MSQEIVDRIVRSIKAKPKAWRYSDVVFPSISSSTGMTVWLSENIKYENLRIVFKTGYASKPIAKLTLEEADLIRAAVEEEKIKGLPDLEVKLPGE